jgi:hypothetical protein
LRRGGWDWPNFDWEDAQIAVLEAFGRIYDAEAARWSCFERSLSDSHLRDYLKHLPHSLAGIVRHGVSLLWLPPVMEEGFFRRMRDRVRSSVRPLNAALLEAAGRYGDLLTGSKSPCAS